jgi:uracil DNA glycosylase
MNTDHDAIAVKPHLPDSWLRIMGDEFQTQETIGLKKILLAEKQAHTVFPPGGDMFNAFWYTAFEAVRVVILGQDPYHGPGPSTWPLFLGQEGCSSTAKSAKRISGVTRRLGCAVD